MVDGHSYCEQLFAVQSALHDARPVVDHNYNDHNGSDLLGLRAALTYFLSPFCQPCGLGGVPKDRGSSSTNSFVAPPSARQLQLAEGVKFLEKNSHLRDLAALFGGEG